MQTYRSARRVAGVMALGLAVAACGSAKANTAAQSPATTTTKAKVPASHAAGSHDMAGMAGHHHNDSKITYAELSPTTKAQVDTVIKWASKYKTAADAKKDGWSKATKSLYGIGSHWLHGGVAGFASFGSTPDMTTPNVLLFDGEGDDAKLAGVSWIMNSPTDPVGFSGPDDHWHRHSSVCFVASEGVVISEGDAEGSPINLSHAGCVRNKGVMFPISNLTMMHLWIGTGYMNGPLFAHDNAKLLDGYRPNENPKA